MEFHYKIEIQTDDIVDFIYNMTDDDCYEIINGLGKKFKRNQDKDLDLESLIYLIKDLDTFYLTEDGEWFLNECKKILKEQ